MNKASSTLQPHLSYVGGTGAGSHALPVHPVSCTQRSRMSRHAQLPTRPCSWRHLLLYRQSARPQQRSADPRGRSLAQGGARGEGAASVPYQCLGGAARTYALHVDATAGRRRLRRTLEGHQVCLRQALADQRVPHAQATAATRARHLATALLGTSDPR